MESIFPVKFTFGQECLTRRVGEIRIGNGADHTHDISDVCSLTLPEGLSKDKRSNEIAVRFSDDQKVPFPFRGRLLRTKVAAEVRAIPLTGNEKVLASCDQGAVWVVSNKGSATRFRSGFPLPSIPADGNFRDMFNGEHFLEMLPLLHFIRMICSPSLYNPPPLRACFIIDDPNLHWPHYGFVDYQQIAAHAAKKNFHVSFATIPLDAWFVHGATAEMFKRNAGRLSMTVHGNNHTYCELAGNYKETERENLLQQAICRIERLERKTGLRVCRVMVPPHGACSEEMLAELPGCGFEAACISHGSLRAHNPEKSWTKSLGYFPSELVRGCPVLPRWGLSGDVRNSVLLAAFLGQPMVFRGHHQDLKNGIELLDDLAEFINDLGSVTWSNMTDISRMNYQWCLDGDTFRVKPLGRKLVLQVPDQASQMVIEEGIQTDWHISGLNGDVVKARIGETVSLRKNVNRAILITAQSPLSVRSQMEATPTPVIAIARRLLTEGRDRLLPFFPSR